MFLIKTFKWNYHTFTWIYMKLVYQNTISRLYEKIIGNLSNVHTQDLNDFIYSAQMKGLHQFHIILQSTYMKFSYTRHIPSYTLQQCIVGRISWGHTIGLTATWGVGGWKMRSVLKTMLWSNLGSQWSYLMFGPMGVGGFRDYLKERGIENHHESLVLSKPTMKRVWFFYETRSLALLSP